MRRWFVFLLLCLVSLAFSPLCWASPPLPLALAQLQQQLTQAQNALAASQAQQQHLAARQQTQRLTFHRTLASLMQARRLPPALLSLQSISHPHLPPMGHILTQASAQQLAQAQQLATQLAAYLRLMRQAQTQLAQLQQIAVTLGQNRTHLHALETKALQQAAVSAAQLTQALQTSPSLTLTPLPPMPKTALFLPVQGRISGGQHQAGLTFTAPANSPVISVTAGQIIYSGPFQNFGGLVIVRGPSQHYLLYAQLATLSVTAGQTVTAGQVLGTLSATPPSQLFFQVRQRGQPISAQNFLTQNI